MNIDTIRSDSSEFEYLDSEIESPFSSSSPFKNVENLEIGGNSDVSMNENDTMSFNQLVQLEKNMGQITNYVEELEQKCEKYEKKINELENREESENQMGSDPSKISIDFDKIWKSIRNSSIEFLQNPPENLTLTTLLILLPVSYFIFKSGETLKKDLDAQEVILEQLSTHFNSIKKKEKRPKPEFLEDFQQISNFPAKFQEFRKNLAFLEARLKNPELLDQVDSIRHRLIALNKDHELIMAQMTADLEFDQRFENRVQKISTEIQNFAAVINSTSNESILEKIPKLRAELDAIRDLWYLGNIQVKHLKANPTNFNLVIDNYNSLLTDHVKEILLDNIPFGGFANFVLNALGF